MADRLGETVLDSASRSTTSSRPDWETVLTHKSMGKTALGGNKAWKREWNSRGPGTRPRECRPTKRRLQSRAASGRMGATDEEVLMVVESQATRLSELDDRNRSIMNENSEIKSVLLKSKEDMGAMRSQMEQMAELLKMMVTQGAMKTSPPNPEGSSTQCELDRGAHEGAAMGEGDPGTCSQLLNGVSLALP